jgi:fumarate hydratase subunit beta
VARDIKRITSPLDQETIDGLSAGDIVLLSGVVYTARDQAHKRLCEALEAGKTPPFDLNGQTIFYAGPAPAPSGAVIGSIGPTTSTRMDNFTPRLLDCGLKAMIGKGNRSKDVVEEIKRHHAVYFVATGGAAAFLARFIKRAEIVAYAELGPEAVRELVIEDMPLVVGIDSLGRSSLWPDYL